MATMLIDSLSGDYDPDEFQDDYSEAVHEMVEAKLSGGEVKHAPEPKDTGEVVDLLEALQRSVDRAKSARGEPVEKKAAPAKKTAAKKSTPAAKKSPTASGAKTAAAKKTTVAKKTTTKTAAKKKAS
jgi:DNA end-binding protein Ku